MGNNFFNQYPDNIVCTYCTGSPFVIDCGIATPPVDEGTRQLEQIGIQLFMTGLNPGVSMRINAYRGVTLIGQSEKITTAKVFAEYPGRINDNFYGWVRFNFVKRVNMSVSQGTRFELELFDYTYNETTAWIGVVLDWPITMGYNSNPGAITAAPVAMDLYSAEAVG